MIFHPTEPRVAAVLDWELSTLGNPLADFTYLLMSWVNGAISAVPDLAAHGIPTMDEMVADYCRRPAAPACPTSTGTSPTTPSASLASCRGSPAGVRDGTANSPQAAEHAARLPAVAAMAWGLAEKAGAR